jgi:K+-sensing histidine kinase KdpD
MGHLSAGQADLVSLIDEQTALLSELTTRLLTTSRLDAGEVTIHATEVAVASLIEEVVATLKDRLASMKLSIEMEDEEIVINGDRQLLVMLLTQYVFHLWDDDHDPRAARECGDYLLGSQLWAGDSDGR